MQQPEQQAPPATIANSPHGSDRRAYLFLTLTSLCWAVNAVLGRYAVDHISPLALVTFRWVVVLALLSILARRQIREDAPLLRKHLPFLFAMGALGFSVFNSLLYTAAHHTPAVNLGILQGALPVFVLVIAYLAYRTPTTWVQVAGVIVAMAGALVVATSGSLERLLALEIGRGALQMIIACVLFAGYTVALRHRPDVSAFGMFAVLALGAFAGSIPLIIAEVALGNFFWPTPTGWLLVLASALIPSLTGQICYMQGVQIIGPKRAGVFINLVPVFVAVLAVLLLGESFELHHAVAMTLVLGGIWLSEQSGDRG